MRLCNTLWAIITLCSMHLTFGNLNIPHQSLAGVFTKARSKRVITILVLIVEIWQKITVKWKLIIWVTWGTSGCCRESVRKLPIIVLSCHFSQQSHSHWLVFLYSWRNFPEMAKLLSYFQLSNCCSFCWHFIVTRRLEKNCKAKPWWKYFVMFDTCLYHENYFNCLQLWHHGV